MHTYSMHIRLNLLLPKSKTTGSLMSFYCAGSGDVTIVSAQVDMDMGRSVFQHCVGLEAVNDGFIEQTEEIDIIFDTSFNGVFGTCSVQILDNDGKCTKPYTPLCDMTSSGRYDLFAPNLVLFM